MNMRGTVGILIVSASLSILASACASSTVRVGDSSGGAGAGASNGPVGGSSGSAGSGGSGVSLLLAQVVGYYHETLKQSPEALKYLEGRGLQSSEMIDRFKLGFANRTLGLRLPPVWAEQRERWVEMGVVVPMPVPIQDSTRAGALPD